MRNAIIQAKMEEYPIRNALEQGNVLHEIVQHFVLAALWRKKAFTRIVFHGGTALKILFGTNRFSEDLDFFSRLTDPEFSWRPFLNTIIETLKAEEFGVEVQLKEETRSAVKKALVKVDPTQLLSSLDLSFPSHPGKKIRVKLEIDTRPPEGSRLTTRYIYFPLTIPITAQALPSGFATKSHALLCRNYVKGRDWYDFIWYIGKRIIPDHLLLAEALNQSGPWKGKGVKVDADWYFRAMKERIEAVDWKKARQDVARFVSADELPSLDSWSVETFLHHLERMKELGSSSDPRFFAF